VGIREHWENADLRQGEFAVSIRSPDPDDFRNLMGTFSNDTYISL